MKKVLRLFSRKAREETGITGLETAIILIAFVVVATVFAFVVLTTGIFSSERGKETVFAGLEKARGTMELRGGVVVTATGTVVDDISFAVATAAGGAPIPLPIGVGPTGTNTTIIAYRDGTVVDDTVVYTVTEIVGDADNLLETGELFTILINVSGGDIDGSPSIDANDRFTFEVQTPVGAVIDITRQMPAAIDPVMQLH